MSKTEMWLEVSSLSRDVGAALMRLDKLESLLAPPRWAEPEDERVGLEPPTQAEKKQRLQVVQVMQALRKAGCDGRVLVGALEICRATIDTMGPPEYPISRGTAWRAL